MKDQKQTDHDLMVQTVKCTAAYWDGRFAVRNGTPCRYASKDATEREEWARGVSDGVQLQAAGKVWWKSRTLWTGLVLVVVGVGLLAFSHYGNNSIMVGMGGGLTAGGILQTALRLMTRQPIYGGGVMFQSTPYHG